MRGAHGLMREVHISSGVRHCGPSPEREDAKKGAPQARFLAEGLRGLLGERIVARALVRPIDLHAHTNVSDGTLSPTALVQRAADAGLVALAVTDHDHVGGLGEARAAGGRLGVEIVPGIELSVEHRGHDVHLLGYLIDERDAALLARLDALRETRARRAERIVEKLNAHGVAITMADVRRHAHEGAAVGRPHVARALVDGGAVASVQEAFDVWLADGKPANVPKAKLAAKDAIDMLHAAGGVAVIAHAVTLPEPARETIVREFAALGLDGIEVWHSKHEAPERARFTAWAQALDLVQTGGSDYHGDNKPAVQLGTGIAWNVQVDERALDALKQRAASRRA